MLYTYYKQTVKTEHMLYAKEIANMYNVMTSTDGLANRFMSHYLDTISKTVRGYEQLYYCTQYGPCKVYPKSVYILAINLLKERMELNKLTTIQLDSKKYKIKILEEQL